MKNPIVAIGLESADPKLLEKWMSQGYLENFRRLREQGTYASLTNIEYHATETEWTTFLTGCLPDKTGYWRPMRFREGTYEMETIGAYDFVEYPPFYALGENYRVAVFDMPQTTLSDQVNGIQVLAWGAHDPQTPQHSQPSQLLPELIDKYGEHPAFKKGYGDNWWDRKYLSFLLEALKTGISRRGAICRDLLQREKWDLFVTIFGETHAAGHNFWHLSQPDHPLYKYTQPNNSLGDPLLAVFQAIDRSLGEILAAAPDDAYVLVFNNLGMGNNFNEVPSMMFLGEFLYRFNFPGKFAIAPGQLGTTPPPPITNPQSPNWGREVWSLKHETNPIRKFLRQWVPGKIKRKLYPVLDKFQRTPKPPDLVSPSKLSDPLGWQPVNWYKPLWPQMKAFALPSFSDGFIRINLQGREPQGIVAPSEYDALCEQLTEELYRLKDARTGKPIVKNVIRTRQSATDRNPKLPDSDLIVVWEERPTDVVDSPNFGRIGPVPYHRTGGHELGGFLMARGPGIEPGSTLREGHAVDVTPTILDLMGAPIPDYYQGKPLLRKSMVRLSR